MKFSRRGTILVVVALIGALTTAAAFIVAHNLRSLARQLVIASLEERFGSAIDLQDLQIQGHGFPHIRASARNIVLRYKGRTDLPPLMTIRSLTALADLRGLWGPRKRIDTVHLEGLHITIPRRDIEEQHGPAKNAKVSFNLPVEFRQVVVDNSLLELMPNRPDKPPRRFIIHHVVFRSAGFDRPAWFHAQIVNPRPTGEIDSEGEFGPWQADKPSLTPIKAMFHFSNANLAELRGISGTLSSTGQYDGVLDRLKVEGETNTPDFAIRNGGKPIALRTHYLAIVDGTDGDTHLTSVEAQFLDSTVLASGDITMLPASHGHRVRLTVVSKDARVQDLLRIIVKGSEPPLTGKLMFRTAFDLPPGKGDILDRLIVNGHFGLQDAKFTDAETQQSIDALSRRARGHPKSDAIPEVSSKISGRVELRDANLVLPDLTFQVPGALVHLAGTYQIDTEALDFHGHLSMQAKLSQTVTGAKSIFLIFADPFFRGANGGSSLPIKVTGTRSAPLFGLDLHGHHTGIMANASPSKNSAGQGK